MTASCFTHNSDTCLKDLSLPNVLVLGASFEFEPFLELLLNERVNVVCMDRNPALPEQLLRRWSGQLVCLPVDFSDHEATMEVVKKWKITHTAALPVGRALIAMGRVNDSFGLVGPSFEVVDILTDKHRYHRFLAEQGLQDYKWKFLDAAASADLSGCYDQLEQEFGYPFIIKPVEGSGSRGAALIRNRAELEAYRVPERFVSGGCLAETALPGEEFCCAGYVNSKGEFQIMTLLGKEVSQPPYRQESAYHCRPYPRESALITAYANKIAACLGLKTSFLTVDVFVTPEDECFFVDIAPRLTGNNVLLAALYNGNNPLHIYRRVMLDGEDYTCRVNPEPAIIRFFDFRHQPVTYSGRPANCSWGSPLPAMDDHFNVLKVEATESGLEMFSPEQRCSIISFENNLTRGETYGGLKDGCDLARGYIMARGQTMEEADALTRRYLDAIIKG